MTAVAVKYPELQQMGAEVLSVSTDSRFTHKIWQEQELSKMIDGGVPYPMLSDAGGRIGRIYGVYEEMAGVNIRGRFIIDPDASEPSTFRSSERAVSLTAKSPPKRTASTTRRVYSAARGKQTDPPAGRSST